MTTRHSAAGVQGLNELTDRSAMHAFYRCAASTIWARRMVAGRPYASLESLLDRADRVLAELGDAEVDEVLAGHPRIGERSQHASSRREQSGVTGAAEPVLAELAVSNRAYEERFGHVYLVFADGRPAAELLAILLDRLENDPETERRVLRVELAKINRSRLTRLVTEPDEEVEWQG